MQCPNDATTLVMSERSGIEIDYCPQCRGIWLDRGELDKLIERAGRQHEHWQQPAEPQRSSQHWNDPQRPGGAPGGLGAVADKLIGEVQRRAAQSGDRRDPRSGDKYDPRYDGRPRSNGSWLGDILG